MGNMSTIKVTRAAVDESIGIDVTFLAPDGSLDFECVVRNVLAGPAEGALHVGDVIHSVNGVACGEIADIQRAMADKLNMAFMVSRPISTPVDD